VKELLDPATATADDDPMPHADAFDVMVQLSKAVPKELTHDVVEFDVARGHVTIQGVVPTVSDAQTIAENMKEHKCFKDVKVARTSQFTEGKTKYTLELDVKCDTAKKKKPATSGAETDSSAQADGKAEAPR
jgi:general secretion pathway protein L